MGVCASLKILKYSNNSIKEMETRFLLISKDDVAVKKVLNHLFL